MSLPDSDEPQSNVLSIDCTVSECNCSINIYNLPKTFLRDFGTRALLPTIRKVKPTTPAIFIRQGQAVSTSTSTATIVAPLVTSTIPTDSLQTMATSLSQVSLSKFEIVDVAVLYSIMKLFFLGSLTIFFC